MNAVKIIGRVQAEVMKESFRLWGIQYKEVVVVEHARPPYNNFDVFIDFGLGEDVPFDVAYERLLRMADEKDRFSEGVVRILKGITDPDRLVGWMKHHLSPNVRLKVCEIVHHNCLGRIFLSEDEAQQFIEENSDWLPVGAYPKPASMAEGSLLDKLLKVVADMDVHAVKDMVRGKVHKTTLSVRNKHMDEAKRYFDSNSLVHPLSPHSQMDCGCFDDELFIRGVFHYPSRGGAEFNLELWSDGVLVMETERLSYVRDVYEFIYEEMVYQVFVKFTP